MGTHEHYLALFKRVNTFVFDVDGVLTDGRVTLLAGEMARVMHAKDGYALQLAVKKGYRVAIITGGHSDTMRTRLQSLGIQDVYTKASNKLEVLEEFLYTYDLQPETLAYMGDDIPDYDVMRTVGVAACPADAAKEIRAISQYIAHHRGGDGCARELIEKVLTLQGHWFDPSNSNHRLIDYTW
ncbi:MAG: HAD hydrolase family protein [Bacteroidota bacterium]